METLAKKDKDYRLLVAGAGHKAEWLQQQTDKSIPKKIIQLRHPDKETLANYYANADVFVHPNPREPSGIALLEAMASGTPTVVPDSGGLLFYATKKPPWLVKPSAQNFAASVKEIINNPELRARKIEQAFEAIQKSTCLKINRFSARNLRQIIRGFSKTQKPFHQSRSLENL